MLPSKKNREILFMKKYKLYGYKLYGYNNHLTLMDQHH